jgi:hypothetical protein
LVILAVIAYNIYQLARPQRIDVTGDSIDLNYITGQSEEYFDIPTIQLSVSQSIQFFEKNAPSLQRIIVTDLNSFENVLSSKNINDPEELLVARGVYTKLSVPMNSYVLNSQQPYPPVSSSASDSTGNSGSIYVASLKRAQVSPLVLDTMMLQMIRNGVFDSNIWEFHPHSVSLFLRFKADELTTLKPCQLQVGMMNTGQMEVLTQYDEDEDNYYIPREYQSSDMMTTLETTSSTWAFADAKNLGKTNMFRLDRDYSEDEFNNFLKLKNYGSLDIDVMDRVNFLYGENREMFQDWTFFVNYVNNLQYTHTKYQCDSEQVGFGEFADMNFYFTSSTRAVVPAVSDNTLILAMTYLDQSTIDYVTANYVPPFDLILVGITGVTETVTVTQWIRFPTLPASGTTSYAKVKIDRSDPVDFDQKAPSDAYDALKAALSQTVPSHGIPSDWTCATNAFNDGSVCDCDCSITAQDPDCARNMPKLFDVNDASTLFRTGDEMHACSYIAYHGFCSVGGTCASLPMLKISDACRVKAEPAAATELRGFFGTEDDFADAGQPCPSCPGDTISETAHMSLQTGQVTCNKKPSAKLNLLAFYKTHIEEDTLNFCRYLTVKIPTGDRTFPTETAKLGYSLTIGYAGSSTALPIKIMNARDPVVTKKSVLIDQLVGISNYDMQELCYYTTGTKLIDVTFGFGNAITFIGPQTTSVVVKPYTDLTDSDSNFLLLFNNYFGKFQVPLDQDSIKVSLGINQAPLLGADYTNTVVLDVSSVTSIEINNEDYQVLTLSRTPVNMNDFTAIGIIGEIVDVTGSCIHAYSLVDYKLFGHLAIVRSAPVYPIPLTVRRSDMSKRDPVAIYFATSIVTSSLFAGAEKICFNSNIGGQFGPGDFVETHMDTFKNTVDDTSVLRVFTDNIEVNSVTDDKPYTPDQYYKQGTSSPESLTVEAALFTTPVRTTFADIDLTLKDTGVPKEGSRFDDDSVFRRYAVKEGREHTVVNHGLSDPDISRCYTAYTDVTSENYQDVDCITEMPPTKVFSFDHVTQINNKWELASADINEVKKMKSYTRIDPENVMSFQHEFIFQHDQDVSYVQDSFLENMPSDGDYDQDGESYLYHGALSYSDVGLNDTQVPAASPVITTRVFVELSSYAGEDVQAVAKKIMRRRRGTWRNYREYRHDKEGLQKELENSEIFQQLEIEFDFNEVFAGNEYQRLTLQPGNKYNLYAEVSLFATYSKGTFGFIDFDKFGATVISSQVTQQSTEYHLRNRAILEFKIVFTDDSKRVINTVSYNIFSFLAGLGAAMALSAYGLIAVKSIQVLFPPVSILLQIQQEDRKKKEMIKKRRDTIRSVLNMAPLAKTDSPPTDPPTDQNP